MVDLNNLITDPVDVVIILPWNLKNEISNFLNQLDMLLIMTVEPGFGGQAFMSEMMPKVQEARKYLDQNHLSKIWLQVDGGITLETISVAYEAGADTFPITASEHFLIIRPVQVGFRKPVIAKTHRADRC